VLLHTVCGGKQKVPAETKYRSACDHSGKSGKQIERCLISTFKVAERMGFKGNYHQWDHLRRIGD
jgi:hypothetical protein